MPVYWLCGLRLGIIHCLKTNGRSSIYMASQPDPNQTNHLITQREFARKN